MVSMIYNAIKNNITDMALKYKIDTVYIINYLLVMYAFFLPLSRSISNTLFFIVLFLFIISGNLKEKLIYALKDKVVWSFLGLVIIHVLWLIGSDNFEYGLERIDGISKILYIIIFISVIRQDFVFKILSAFLLGVCFNEFTSYLIFFEIIRPINNATVVNPVPFLLNHTVYAIVLAIALSISLSALLNKIAIAHKVLKIVSILLVMSISINIFIISSRLGYILFSVVILSVMFIYFKKYILRMAIVVVISYVVAYLGIDNFKNRTDLMFYEISKIYSSQNLSGSLGVRVGFHLASRDVFEEKLFFGVGTGDHIDYLKNKINQEEVYEFPKAMMSILNYGKGTRLDSDFLELFIQFGVVGVFIFLLILYNIYKYNQSNKFLKGLQILLIIIILINGAIQGMIYFSPLNKIFVLLIALTLNLYYDNNKCKMKCI